MLIIMKRRIALQPEVFGTLQRPESRKRNERRRAVKSLAAESCRGEMRGVCGCCSPQVGLGAPHSQRHLHHWTPIKTPSLFNLKPLSLLIAIVN